MPEENIIIQQITIMEGEGDITRSSREIKKLRDLNSQIGTNIKLLDSIGSIATHATDAQENQPSRVEIIISYCHKGLYPTAEDFCIGLRVAHKTIHLEFTGTNHKSSTEDPICRINWDEDTTILIRR